MKEKKENISMCPDFEQISAFFDHELDPNSEEYLHIASCKICAENLKVLEQIETSVQSHLDNAVDDKLVSRIRSKVKESIKSSKSSGEMRPVPFVTLIMRIAAIFIFFTGMLIIMLQFVNRHRIRENCEKSQLTLVKGSNNKKQDSVMKADFKNSRQFLEVTQLKKSNRNLTRQASAPGFVPLEELEPVSIDSCGGKIQFTAKTDNKLQVTFIPAKVNHVWVTDNIETLKRILKAFVKNNKIYKSKMKFVSTKDSLKLHVRLTKRELVKLVKLCSAKGNELLSPTAPQPEQIRFYGKPDTPVQYNAKFIVRNN